MQLAPSLHTHHAARTTWWHLLLLAFVLSTWAAGCSSLPANVARTPSQAFNAPDQTELGRLVLARKAADRGRAASGFSLVDDPDTAFRSRLALIDAAQRSLDLQYYAIHADSTTEVLLQHLRDAARRGVRVRILLDDFNTVGRDAQVLRLALEPHVEIRLFNPLPGSRNSLVGHVITSLHDMDRVQKRMHNKLFIADNAMSITGGRNLGDSYFGIDEKSNFVDLEVLAAGPVVRDLSASFDRYWNDPLAYPMQSLVSPEDLERLRNQPAEAGADPSGSPPKGAASAPALVPTSTILPTATPTQVPATEQTALDLRRVPFTWAPSAVLVDEPGKIGPDEDEVNAGETVVDGLIHLMQDARQDVLIISPYFVPGKQLMDLFRQLRDRGVRVRVLTNSLASNDAVAAHAGYARYRKALLDARVELYEMRSEQGAEVSGEGSSHALGSGAATGGSKSGTSRASLHSKAVFIDSRLSVIGSMNLDLRSQKKNSEVALLIRSAGFTQAATREVEATLARGVYRLELDHDQFVWHAPPGAPYPDERSEPGASTKLKLLAGVIGPFAPDEML